MSALGKYLALTLVGITILSVTVVVTLPQAEKAIGPMVEIPDRDKDGVPDDRDLDPGGNALVKLSLTEFHGKDACGNWLPLGNPACDPEFQVEWDINMDGNRDGHLSKKYTDTNSITNVLQETIDIPEDSTRIWVIVQIIDRDGDEVLDYWSDMSPNWGYVELRLTHGGESISLSGHGEVSGSLSILVEVSPF